MIWNVIPILKMLTLCARNPPVMDGFLVQRVSNVGFDVFFVVSLNIGLKEQLFEMSYPSSKWFTCLYWYFVISLNKGLTKQWFEMSYTSCDVTVMLLSWDTWYQLPGKVVVIVLSKTQFAGVQMKTDPHWFRKWLGATQATCHYPYQCWLLSRWVM